MADAASGISHVLDWQEWVFINVELGIHLERAPGGRVDGDGRDHSAGPGRRRIVHQHPV